MAYSRKHLDHPLDYMLLLSLLQELDKLWEPTSLSREEVIIAPQPFAIIKPVLLDYDSCAFYFVL